MMRLSRLPWHSRRSSVSSTRSEQRTALSPLFPLGGIDLFGRGISFPPARRGR